MWRQNAAEPSVRMSRERERRAIHLFVADTEFWCRSAVNVEVGVRVAVGIAVSRVGHPLSALLTASIKHVIPIPSTGPALHSLPGQLLGLVSPFRAMLTIRTIS